MAEITIGPTTYMLDTPSAVESWYTEELRVQFTYAFKDEPTAWLRLTTGEAHAMFSMLEKYLGMRRG